MAKGRRFRPFSVARPITTCVISALLRPRTSPTSDSLGYFDHFRAIPPEFLFPTSVRVGSKNIMRHCQQKGISPYSDCQHMMTAGAASSDEDLSGQR